MLSRNAFGTKNSVSAVAGETHQVSQESPSDIVGNDESKFTCLFEPIYRRQDQLFVPAGHKLISRYRDTNGNTSGSLSGYSDDNSLDLFRAIELGMSQLEMLESQVEAFLAEKSKQKKQKLVVEVDIYDLQGNQQNLAELGEIISRSAIKGLMPQDIVVELSGSINLDVGVVCAIAGRLKELGVMIALINLDADQFSFKRIFKVQPQIVKFNRTWFEQKIEDPQYVRMVETLIVAIHRMGIFTTMTGIRKRSEFEFTATCGFSRGQGSFFGRPSKTAEQGMPVHINCTATHYQDVLSKNTTFDFR